MPQEDGVESQQQDELGKEFDEIVAQSDDSQSDDGSVEVPVRRDTTPEPNPFESQDTVGESESSTSDVEVEQAAEVPVEPTPVVATPAATTHHSSGGSMVLQWLSYAFWGWFGVAMAWLTAVTVAYFIVGNTSDVASTLAYPLASVIVLYLLALLTDLFYARREPAQKSGGPNAIMLIHVVLFVLIAVGAAVTGLFSLISMLISTDVTSGTDGQVVAAWTSLMTIVVFALIAARALFGGRKTAVRLSHWVAMSVLAIGVIAFSIAGPVAGAQLSKDDRVIEEGLPTLSQVVGEYVNDNGKLPATLAEANDASAGSSAASSNLVSRNLVRYTPNVKQSTKENLYGAPDKSDYQTTYYYRFCVTYKQAKKASGTYYDSSSSSGGKYSPYLTIYGHAKGEVCYNLKASDSYGIVYPMDAVEGSTKQ